MDKSFDTLKHEWRWIAVLFLTAAILFGISMSRTGFEGKDERRYAQVAKEITWGENIFVMHHLGKLYPDKPPLFFWMQAISYKVFGEVSPFSARVPLWIVSMLALAFSYLCVRQINGPRAALIASIALLLMFRFFWSGRWARLDMPMCAFTFGAFWASARILFPRANQSAAHWGWAMLAWAMAALAILSKGPGILAWLGAILLFALVRKDASVLRKHHLFTGVILTLAIVGAWLVPAMILGGRDYWGPMFGIHVVERFAGVVRHEKPFFYYLGKVFSDTMPVALLLPVALVHAWKRRNSPDEGRTQFYLCWFAFSMAFFSFPTGKRGQYILPLYPAAAAMVAQFVIDALRNERARIILHRHTLGMSIAALCVAAIIFFMTGTSEFPVAPSFAFRVTLSGLVVVFSVVAMLLARSHQDLRSLGVLALGVCTVYGGYFLTVLPENRDDYIVRLVAQLLNEEENLALFGLDSEITLYRDSIPNILESRKQATHFMQSENARLLAPRREYQKLVEKDGVEDWLELGCWAGPTPDDEIVLLAPARKKRRET